MKNSKHKKNCEINYKCATTTEGNLKIFRGKEKVE